MKSGIAVLTKNEECLKRKTPHLRDFHAVGFGKIFLFPNQIYSSRGKAIGD
jgi:hypothetical protein